MGKSPLRRFTPSSILPATPRSRTILWPLPGDCLALPCLLLLPQLGCQRHCLHSQQHSLHPGLPPLSMLLWSGGGCPLLLHCPLVCCCCLIFAGPPCCFIGWRPVPGQPHAIFA
jgi:hypothetical protein